MALFHILSFFLWPFGSLFFSFKNYSKKWTKNIIWAFVVFYGFTFVLSNTTMDANRLKSKFEIIQHKSFSLNSIISSYLVYGEDTLDLIQPIIFHVTSIFSNDFQVLMAVLAVIFGYFYSRNITYLMERKESNFRWINYVILALFMVVIGFWNINGFRFWTSAHIFFYAVIPYIYENKKNRLWVLPLAPLLHFSFLFPILSLLVFVIFKIRPKLYITFFILSLLITSVDTEAVGNFLMRVLPNSFHWKIKSYTSADYAAEIADAESSTSALLRYSANIAVNLSFTYIYFYYRKQIKNIPSLYRLFYFSILLVTLSNFFSLIPSGQRFLAVSSLFSLSFLYFFIQKGFLKGRLKILFHVATPLFILAIIGYIRLGFNTINLLAVLGNPIILTFIDSKIAFINLF